MGDRKCKLSEYPTQPNLHQTRSVEVSDLCRREGVNPLQFDASKKQLIGSASRVFEDKRGLPNAIEQRREAEVQKLKNVIAEITSENLDLKKGCSG